MNKHKFNVFPEMSAEEFGELVKNIDAHGFDQAFPVVTYQGEVLDGWNRYRAAEKLGIAYPKEPFTGSDMDALDYVLRTNVRRNLSASIRAAVMAEADEIIRMISDAVEQERGFKSSKSQLSNDVKLDGALCTLASNDPPQELTYEIDQPQNNQPQHQTRKRLAQIGGVSDNYIKNASALKKKSPEAFEQVKRGEISLPKAVKEVKEASAINDILNDPRRDEITLLAAEYGNKFQTAVRNFKALIDDAGTSFARHGFRFSDFAPRTVMVDLKGVSNEAHFLKKYVKCPMCSGAKCEHCTSGYVTENTEAALVDIKEHAARTANG